jgi:hypothetical protein
LDTGAGSTFWDRRQALDGTSGLLVCGRVPATCENGKRLAVIVYWNGGDGARLPTTPVATGEKLIVGVECDWKRSAE